MLGEQITADKKTFLNIKEGAIVRRTPEGEEKKYTFVEGQMAAITQKERTFRGEIVVYWYMDLRDDSGEIYSLGFPFASNIFKSIILQLASEEGLESLRKGNTIRIEPYTKDGYSKVQVWGGEKKLSWKAKQLPPIEEAMVGGRKIKDDSKRMAYISSLTEDVKRNIRKQ